MLVRFALKNFLSFGKQKEFHFLPNTRLKTLQDHLYHVEGIDLLKLTALYGAVGAGKSNLVYGLSFLQHLVLNGEIPQNLKKSQFKFQQDKENTPQVLAIEFIQQGIAFYYAIELKNGIIITEELYQSGLGKKEDVLIFERKTDALNKTSLQFSADFEKSKKNQMLKEILLQEFIRPDKPILKLIANRESKELKIVKKAFDWFQNSLQIITPEIIFGYLPQQLDTDKKFRKYFKDLVCAFHVGVKDVIIKKEDANTFFGIDNKEYFNNILRDLENSPQKILHLERGINVVKENEQTLVKTLHFKHENVQGIEALFDLSEESDGTVRLLDFVPVFRDLISQQKVYVIDEINRSLHPLIIKELIRKFSLDSDTKGQLLFTTHEAYLLDQEIFRQDEIWFAEKDETGNTDLYSLNTFKGEHKTIDIQKGYLSGRYRAIPFLGNLQDLNWHNYDTEE
ncbi:MAG: ATP-binding protein [Bacteroidetes bacterium]|nr:MAG: ATP-binding protein [Bacteroidota bacterium]